LGFFHVALFGSLASAVVGAHTTDHGHHICLPPQAHWHTNPPKPTAPLPPCLPPKPTHTFNTPPPPPGETYKSFDAPSDKHAATKRRLRLCFLALLLWLGGAYGLHRFEGPAWTASMYWSIALLTSANLGELAPITLGGKLLTAWLSLLGCVAFGRAIGEVRGGTTAALLFHNWPYAATSRAHALKRAEPHTHADRHARSEAPNAAPGARAHVAASRRPTTKPRGAPSTHPTLMQRPE
jgi:hypothetical protein